MSNAHANGTPKRGWIYEVSPVDDSPVGVAYTSTLREAMRLARDVAAEGQEATVIRNRVAKLPRTRLHVALLNRSGWAAESEDVAVVPAKEVFLD